MKERAWAIPVPESIQVVKATIYGADKRASRGDGVERNFDAQIVKMRGKTFLVIHKTCRDIDRLNLDLTPGGTVIIGKKTYTYVAVYRTTGYVLELVKEKRNV